MATASVPLEASPATSMLSLTPAVTEFPCTSGVVIHDQEPFHLVHQASLVRLVGKVRCMQVPRRLGSLMVNWPRNFWTGAFIHDAETVVIHRRACAPYSNTIVCNPEPGCYHQLGLTITSMYRALACLMA